jgi:peptidoglycan/LPS O-acetylase OafA/YrhL
VNGAAHRPQLDALRALAVFTVLADHFWAALPSFGQLAVQLFFVLSGFLITSQLLDAREALGASPPPQARRRLIGHFVARRALRIFPAYYALLLLLFVVDAPGVRRDIVALAAYATNWLQALRNDWGGWPTAHLWSLAIEEQFYLVWPLLAVLLPRRALPWALAIAIGLAPLARGAVLAAAAPAAEPPLALWVLTPAVFDALGGGAVLALVRHDAVAQARLQRAGVIAFVLWLGVAMPAHNVAALDPFARALAPLLWALACAALVQAAARGIGGRVGAVLAHRALVALGRISYGIYLYHLAVYWALTRVLERAGLTPLADGPVKLLVCGALTVAVAALSWRVLEQPLQRLKRHFPWPSAAPRG